MLALEIDKLANNTAEIHQRTIHSPWVNVPSAS
jgi:hypothetical protein